jgi:hypothetical protein
MSLCEKSAWISFIVILVSFGAYFVGIGVDPPIMALTVLVQATLLAVWVAELTRFGTEIYYYRRGLA